MADTGFSFDVSDLGPAELYEIAFLLEDEGFKFYDAIAGAAADLRVSSEVGFLRDEEARHRAYFRSRLQQDPSGDQASRVRTFVRREFVEPLSEYYDADRIRKSGEALRFGAVLEQKSIDFYSALEGRESDEAARARIAEILAEERRHLKKIYQILVG